MHRRLAWCWLAHAGSQSGHENRRSLCADTNRHETLITKHESLEEENNPEKIMKTIMAISNHGHGHDQGHGHGH